MSYCQCFLRNDKSLLIVLRFVQFINLLLFLRIRILVLQLPRQSGFRYPWTICASSHRWQCNSRSPDHRNPYTDEDCRSVREGLQVSSRLYSCCSFSLLRECHSRTPTVRMEIEGLRPVDVRNKKTSPNRSLRIRPDGKELHGAHCRFAKGLKSSKTRFTNNLSEAEHGRYSLQPYW